MEEPEKYAFQTGALLLIDKPKEWTSFDVVNKLRYTLRKALGIKKIKMGHAGTLDPLATGLLVVCTGKFTKKIESLQGMSKEYTGSFHLGATTPSYDAETAIDEQFPIEHISPELLDEARQKLLGDLDQIPPIFSAIKVDGQPLYKKARKGEKIKIKARKVTIHDFRLEKIEMPIVNFWVYCSKGTYIRSLAHDFGKALKSGAYLADLRRTKVGQYKIEDAWNLEKLIQYIRANYSSRDKLSKN